MPAAPASPGRSSRSRAARASSGCALEPPQSFRRWAWSVADDVNTLRSDFEAFRCRFADGEASALMGPTTTGCSSISVALSPAPSPGKRSVAATSDVVVGLAPAQAASLRHVVDQALVEVRDEQQTLRCVFESEHSLIRQDLDELRAQFALRLVTGKDASDGKPGSLRQDGARLDAMEKAILNLGRELVAHAENHGVLEANYKRLQQREGQTCGRLGALEEALPDVDAMLSKLQVAADSHEQGLQRISDDLSRMVEDGEVRLQELCGEVEARLEGLSKELRSLPRTFVSHAGLRSAATSNRGEPSIPCHRAAPSSVFADCGQAEAVRIALRANPRRQPSEAGRMYSTFRAWVEAAVGGTVASGVSGLGCSSLVDLPPLFEVECERGIACAEEPVLLEACSELQSHRVGMCQATHVGMSGNAQELAALTATSSMCSPRPLNHGRPLQLRIPEYLRPLVAEPLPPAEASGAVAGRDVCDADVLHGHLHDHVRHAIQDRLAHKNESLRTRCEIETLTAEFCKCRDVCQDEREESLRTRMDVERFTRDLGEWCDKHCEQWLCTRREIESLAVGLSECFDEHREEGLKTRCDLEGFAAGLNERCEAYQEDGIRIRREVESLDGGLSECREACGLATRLCEEQDAHNSPTASEVARAIAPVDMQHAQEARVAARLLAGEKRMQVIAGEISYCCEEEEQAMIEIRRVSEDSKNFRVEESAALRDVRQMLANPCEPQATCSTIINETLRSSGKTVRSPADSGALQRFVVDVQGERRDMMPVERAVGRPLDEDIFRNARMEAELQREWTTNAEDPPVQQSRMSTLWPEYSSHSRIGPSETEQEASFFLAELQQQCEVASTFQNKVWATMSEGHQAHDMHMKAALEHVFSCLDEQRFEQTAVRTTLSTLDARLQRIASKLEFNYQEDLKDLGEECVQNVAITPLATPQCQEVVARCAGPEPRTLGGGGSLDSASTQTLDSSAICSRGQFDMPDPCGRSINEVVGMEQVSHLVWELRELRNEFLNSSRQREEQHTLAAGNAPAMEGLCLNCESDCPALDAHQELLCLRMLGREKFSCAPESVEQCEHGFTLKREVTEVLCRLDKQHTACVETATELCDLRAHVNNAIDEYRNCHEDELSMRTQLEEVAHGLMELHGEVRRGRLEDGLELKEGLGGLVADLEDQCGIMETFQTELSFLELRQHERGADISGGGTSPLGDRALDGLELSQGLGDLAAALQEQHGATALLRSKLSSVEVELQGCTAQARASMDRMLACIDEQRSESCHVALALAALDAHVREAPASLTCALAEGTAEGLQELCMAWPTVKQEVASAMNEARHASDGLQELRCMWQRAKACDVQALGWRSTGGSSGGSNLPQSARGRLWDSPN